MRDKEQKTEDLAILFDPNIQRMEYWRDSRSEIGTQKFVECKNKGCPNRERNMWSCDPKSSVRFREHESQALKSATHGVTKERYSTLSSQASGVIYILHWHHSNTHDYVKYLFRLKQFSLLCIYCICDSSAHLVSGLT